MFLSNLQSNIIIASSNAFFPKDGPIPASGEEAGMVSFFEDTVSHAPRSQKILLTLLLYFIQCIPILLGPKRKFLTALSSEERMKSLERMSKSNFYFIRLCFQSLRMIFCMGYLENKKVSDLVFKKDIL